MQHHKKKTVNQTVSLIPVETALMTNSDLADMVSKAAAAAAPYKDYLEEEAYIKFYELKALNAIFILQIRKQRPQALTSSMSGDDIHCDTLFAELIRNASAGAQSSHPKQAAAGVKLQKLFHPLEDMPLEPIVDHAEQIQLLSERYYADPKAITAAGTLGVTQMMEAFFSSNRILLSLYNHRLSNFLAHQEPPATCFKMTMVKAYKEFCKAILRHLLDSPSPELKQLIGAINEHHRTYIAHLPTLLDTAHTFIDPIPPQPYTGKPVTPQPCVYYQTETDIVDLVFEEDFTTTCHNNIKRGTAAIRIHGKGKYHGRYDATFEIT
ncbi:MAG: DUF6261 family protein [Prevotellaceae bacterium]|jgi:hypothetical protein|nr:DUF6261 family protein [Prevotellaceae bacterium]